LRTGDQCDPPPDPQSTLSREEQASRRILWPNVKLAYIEDSQRENLSAIWMHIALNDPATPDYVFSHVLKHELLHTRIIPRQVNGVWSAHPPEFREEESRIDETDASAAWEWIDANFNCALQRDNEHECIWVNNRRMKELLQTRHCGEQDSQQFREAFRVGHQELRFGYRKQALRAFDPKRDA
jgi:hypothetical protein